MPEKKIPNVPRPNAFLYYSVVFLAGLYFRWILGWKVERSDIKGLKPPFFVLAGHGIWLDDIADVDELITGRRREGLYSGVSTFLRHTRYLPDFRSAIPP